MQRECIVDFMAFFEWKFRNSYICLKLSKLMLHENEKKKTTFIGTRNNLRERDMFRSHENLSEAWQTTSASTWEFVDRYAVPTHTHAHSECCVSNENIFEMNSWKCYTLSLSLRSCGSGNIIESVLVLFFRLSSPLCCSMFTQF